MIWAKGKGEVKSLRAQNPRPTPHPRRNFFEFKRPISPLTSLSQPRSTSNNADF